MSEAEIRETEVRTGGGALEGDRRHEEKVVELGAILAEVAQVGERLLPRVEGRRHVAHRLTILAWGGWGWGREGVGRAKSEGVKSEGVESEGMRGEGVRGEEVNSEGVNSEGVRGEGCDGCGG